MCFGPCLQADYEDLRNQIEPMAALVQQLQKDRAEMTGQLEEVRLLRCCCQQFVFVQQRICSTAYRVHGRLYTLSRCMRYRVPNALRSSGRCGCWCRAGQLQVVLLGLLLPARSTTTANCYCRSLCQGPQFELQRNVWSSTACVGAPAQHAANVCARWCAYTVKHRFSLVPV
jgi:hypothetical protein